MAALQDVLEEIIPTWPVHGNYFPLSECGLSLAQIAYTNVVRCRTKDNQIPSVHATGTCIERHFGPWLDLLQPRLVVCIGMWAHNRIAGILDQRGIPHTFMNRRRDLSAMDKVRNREEVALFVKQCLAGVPAGAGAPSPAPGPVPVPRPPAVPASPRREPVPTPATRAPSAAASSMRRTTDDGFEVRLTQLPSGRCQIDLYHDDQHLGEYERSSQGEVERKVAEVIAARHFLFDVFRNHGPWVVRWATSVRTGKRTKCVRVDGVEVTEVPGEHWGDPSWVR